MGSSYLPSEITAALLRTQLENAHKITTERVSLWNRYHTLLEKGEANGYYRRPSLTDDCQPNGHLYYLLLPTGELREALRATLNQQGIEAIFHYLPLHDSPAGKKFAKTMAPLSVTEDICWRILRLPLWEGMTGEVEQVVAAIEEWTRQCRK